MDLEFRGRLKNFLLPASAALVPVFEAIINGVHAVREANTRSGRVTVEIERTGQRDFDGGQEPIVGFLIRDNGIGFNDENFRSFETSDTQKKANIGGRGVGRLTWIKAFDEVFVDSFYRSPDGMRRRRFHFSAEGILQPTDTPDTSGRPPGTTIALRKMKPTFYKELPKGGDTITQRMVDHFIIALPNKREAQVLVIDGEQTFDVTDEIATVLQTAKKSKLTIAGIDFQLTHLRVLSNDIRGHRIAYLADSRVVKSEILRDIPHFRSRLPDGEGNTFWSRTLVQSRALDEAVSPERDTFHFPDEPDSLDIDPRGQITMKGIRDSVIPAIEKDLQRFLAPLREKAVEQAQAYVEQEAPQYRNIIKLKRDAVASLPPDLPREKLDIELRRIRFQHEEEIGTRATAMLQDNNASPDAEAYSELISQINSAAIDDLAKYVRDRRIILNLLRKAVRQDSEGKYGLEDAIHRLILPMRTTSDDVPYDQMNLWLIDERLAFHSYLASDKPFSSLAPVDSASTERPDVIVFNRPLAFSEYPAPAFQSVVIIEFKRPMRDDYDERENPIAQVFRYIRQVRTGTATQRDGRPFIVQPSVPFYCYIICDTKKNLVAFAEDAGLLRSWDGQGWFGYNPNQHAYIEIVSFDKLIDDAEKRNRVFFEKLGLPKA